MPVKRTLAKARTYKLTENDFAALIAGEGIALHRALGLKPWEFRWLPILAEAKAGQRTVAELMERREEIEAGLLAGKNNLSTMNRQG
jgi:hypothetical protein